MVTKVCPYNGNEGGCPAIGGRNRYGYQYRFDIMTKTNILGDDSTVYFGENAQCRRK
jgi:hypothetical protein